MSAFRVYGLLVLIPQFAACRGASDKSEVRWLDPDTVEFEYGAGTDAASSQAVVGTARLVEAAVAEAAGPADVPIEYSRAMEIVWSARLIAEETFEGTDAREPEKWTNSFSSCFVVRDTEVLWDDCLLTETGHGDFTVSRYDGRLTRTSSNLSWDATWTIDGTGDTFRANALHHWTGELVVTPGRVVGFARYDLSSLVGSLAGTDRSRAAVTYNLDLDLYLDANLCPQRGTLEVKDLWVARGDGEVPTVQGALFTWSACGQVTVSLATR